MDVRAKFNLKWKWKSREIKQQKRKIDGIERIPKLKGLNDLVLHDLISVELTGATPDGYQGVYLWVKDELAESFLALIFEKKVVNPFHHQSGILMG